MLTVINFTMCILLAVTGDHALRRLQKELILHTEQSWAGELVLDRVATAERLHEDIRIDAIDLILTIHKGHINKIVKDYKYASMHQRAFELWLTALNGECKFIAEVVAVGNLNKKPYAFNYIYNTNNSFMLRPMLLIYIMSSTEERGVTSAVEILMRVKKMTTFDRLCVEFLLANRSDAIVAASIKWKISSGMVSDSTLHTLTILLNRNTSVELGRYVLQVVQQIPGHIISDELLNAVANKLKSNDNTTLVNSLSILSKVGIRASAYKRQLAELRSRSDESLRKVIDEILSRLRESGESLVRLRPAKLLAGCICPCPGIGLTSTAGGVVAQMSRGQ